MKTIKNFFSYIEEKTSDFFNNFEEGLTKVLVVLSPIYILWMVYQAFA
jgi:hypothetical protein